MSNAGVDSEYLRTAPIPDLVALYESARAKPDRLADQLQAARVELSEIEQALRDRLFVEHPGKYLVVGRLAYRTNSDRRGMDRVEVEYPPGPGILPPAPHLESERSEGR